VLILKNLVTIVVAAAIAPTGLVMLMFFALFTTLFTLFLPRALLAIDRLAIFRLWCIVSRAIRIRAVRRLRVVCGTATISGLSIVLALETCLKAEDSD
jgi:hypothetical protein